MNKDPYVIGLTGNIATGKSTVAKILARLGPEHIDADTLAHRVMSVGQPVYHKVVDAFGPYILAPGGEIDRAKLGKIVFADPHALARLEAIVHPAVIARTRERIERTHAGVAVIEAIKLIESGVAVQLCDTVWVVTAPRAVQIQRLIQERDLSHQDAVLRIDAQPDQQAKVAHAEVVIDNGGSLEQTSAQVEQAWAKIEPISTVQRRKGRKNGPDNPPSNRK